jgi:hypothetical protein
VSGRERPIVVLDGEARRFLRRTGVLVVAVEAAVLLGILAFQLYFTH